MAYRLPDARHVPHISKVAGTAQHSEVWVAIVHGAYFYRDGGFRKCHVVHLLPLWPIIDTLSTFRDICRSVAGRAYRKLPSGPASQSTRSSNVPKIYRLKPTVCAAPPHPRRSVRVSALSAVQEEALLLEHEKTFTYGKEFAMTVNVTEAANGDQTVYIETDYPSANLILHWGVQGGRSYTGGWRLPDHRPKDTIQYKDRALQTSFKCGPAHCSCSLLITPYITAQRAATGHWLRPRCPTLYGKIAILISLFCN